MNIGRQMPQAFAAKNPKGVSLDNPGNYRFMTSDKAGAEESFRKLNQPEEGIMENTGSSIGALHGAARHAARHWILSSAPRWMRK